MNFSPPDWRDRLAIVRMPLNLVETKPYVVAHAFTRCVILRAEMLLERMAIEYVVASPDFDLAPGHNCPVPILEIEVGRTGFPGFRSPSGQ